MRVTQDYREWPIDLAWFAKPDAAGVVYPLCKLCNKKIANRKADIMQYSSAVAHERNENTVSGVRMLNVPVFNKYVSAEVKKAVIELAQACLMLPLLNSNCWSSKIEMKLYKSMEKAALYFKLFVTVEFGIYLVYLD